MLKGLILFSNLALALIMNVIFGEGVKVTQNSPNQVDPGGEFVVEIVINKTDVTGFAKIVQELPEGFMAEAIETQGASFTYNDNKVKLIWMALPQEDEFSIKYKVTVGSEVTGEKIVVGKFSYLLNNERKTVDIPKNKIFVGTEEIVESTLAETIPAAAIENSVEPETTPSEPETIIENQVEPETTPSEPETIIENQVEDVLYDTIVENSVALNTDKTKSEQVTKITLESIGQNKPEPIVVGERKVKDLGNGTFQIEISINQNGIEGFAKAQEQLPKGITLVKGGETNNAVFSFVDEQAKFVWMNVPKDNPIYITYTITGGEVSADQLRNMDGTFAYLYNEETKKAKITPSANQPEAVKPIVETNTEITKNEKIAEKTSNQVEVISIIETATEPTSSIPVPENGITYKVQICAGHAAVETNSYFKRAFSFSEGPIMLENHNGWIKYTIGGFDTYKIARARRNVVTAGYELPGPFVSAYNDGTRITVQEALMISNQKWIQ